MEKSEDFEDIHFTDCFIDEFHISKNSIEVEIRNLRLTKENEFYRLTSAQNVDYISKSNLIFKGVTSSERIIYEYKDNGRGFKETHKISDGPFESSTSNRRKYFVEGLITKSNAWVDLTKF